MTPTTAALADELERLAGEATPGPWAVDGDVLVTRDPVEVDMERVMIADLRYFTITHLEANAALIVALVNRLPAIISALRSDGRMREGVAEALYQLEHVMGLTVKSEAAYQHNITLAIGSLKALSESDNDQDR